MMDHNHAKVTTAIVILILIGFLPDRGDANSSQILSRGQTVYVPVYSHIYHGNQEKKFDLTATLSIRNTNLDKDITLRSIDYYDSEGELLKKYLEAPIALKKISTVRYVIKARDKRGGSGAKFLVRWKSETLSNAPIIEAIMISTQSQQGISFVSRGQAIHE
jgi:hypothetical protein